MTTSRPILRPVGAITCAIAMLLARPVLSDAASGPPPATGPATGPAVAAADPALAARVNALLVQLEAGDYRARERATAAVEELPPAALPFIEKAVASGDLSPEVSARLSSRMSILLRKSAATKYEQRLRAMLEWERTASLAAYDRGGHTDPKWDAAAREGIVLHVRPRRDPNISPKDQARIAAALKRAVDLGCDDPLVRYYYNRRRFQTLKPGADPRPVAAEMKKAADGILAGDYPSYYKMEAAFTRVDEAVRFHRPPELKRDAVSADLDKILSLVGPAIKEGTPQHLIVGVLTPMRDYVAQVERGDRLAGHRRMMKALDAQAKGTTIPAYFEADFYIARGYLIREDPNVGEDERAKLLADCAKSCKAAVDAGLAPDPVDADAINRMIRYLCLVRAPADEFDRWFDKGLRAYPNDLVACQMKHAYLRENGTPAQRVEFGRWCVRQGNWPSRIPLIICDVYADLGSDPHDPDVWHDLSATYEAYLARFPNAYADRTGYCLTACMAEQWDVAKAQFDSLGDNLVWTFFGSQQQLDGFRKKAAEAGKEPPAGPAGSGR